MLPARAVPASANGVLDSVGLVLARHLDQFAEPGVVSVRPGWLLRQRRITINPVIVVNVEAELLRELVPKLPKTVEGLPVDVRPAGAMKRMRADDPARFVALGAARHELREPEFADETFFDARGRALPQSSVAALL